MSAQVHHLRFLNDGDFVHHSTGYNCNCNDDWNDDCKDNRDCRTKDAPCTDDDPFPPFAVFSSPTVPSQFSAGGSRHPPGTTMHCLTSPFCPPRFLFSPNCTQKYKTQERTGTGGSSGAETRPVGVVFLASFLFSLGNGVRGGGGATGETDEGQTKYIGSRRARGRVAERW